MVRRTVRTVGAEVSFARTSTFVVISMKHEYWEEDDIEYYVMIRSNQFTHWICLLTASPVIINETQKRQWFIIEMSLIQSKN